MRDYRAITVGTSEHVHTITLNRPERKNPLGPEMVNELLWALDDAAEDADVRVVVLTGAGAAFSAGGDFGGPSGASVDETPKGDFSDLLLALVRATKPVIARVNGVAMGGGIGLVAACTFAVAAEGVTLGTPEINLGLFPMMIMAVLRRVVRKRRLMELMLTGESISAQEAAEIELVSRAVPDAALDAEVLTLAQKLAAQSPTAMRMGLSAWHAQSDLSLAEALPELRARLMTIIGTEDAREGLSAFLEKRDPVWTGR